MASKITVADLFSIRQGVDDALPPHIEEYLREVNAKLAGEEKIPFEVFGVRRDHEDLLNSRGPLHLTSPRELELLKWYMKSIVHINKPLIDSFDRFVFNLNDIVNFSSTIIPVVGLDNNVVGSVYLKFSVTNIISPSYLGNSNRQPLVLYPFKAIEQGKTYGIQVYGTFGLFHDPEGKIPVAEFVPPHSHPINIAKIPIMVRSYYCNLNNKSEQEMGALGEDPYDWSLRFIIGGTEYAIVSPQQIQMYKVYTYNLSKMNNMLILHAGFLNPIRNVTRYLSIRLSRKQDRGIIRVSVPSLPKKESIVTTSSIIREDRAAQRVERYLNIFLLLGLMGWVDVDEIRDKLIRPFTSEKNLNKVWTAILPSFAPFNTYKILRQYAAGSTSPGKPPGIIVVPIDIEGTVYEVEVYSKFVVPDASTGHEDILIGEDGLPKQRLDYFALLQIFASPKKFHIDMSAYNAQTQNYLHGPNDLMSKVMSVILDLSPHTTATFEPVESIKATLGEVFAARKMGRPAVWFVESQLCKSTALMLGMFITRYTEVRLGLRASYDRDSWDLTRVKFSQHLMADLFRQFWRDMIGKINSYVASEPANFRVIQSGDQKLRIQFANESLLQHVQNILRSRSFESVAETSFKSKWGYPGQRPRTGISQLLDRLNLLAALTHGRRVYADADNHSTAMGPRMLHASQVPAICVSQTPDGQKAGLTKNISLLSRSSDDRDDSEIIANIRNMPSFSFEWSEQNKDIADSKHHPVFVNLKMIGWVDIVYAHHRLVKDRREGRISFDVSIWMTPDNELYVQTLEPRMITPFLIVGENGLLEIDNKKMRGKMSAFDPVNGCVEYLDASELAWAKIATNEGMLYSHILRYSRVAKELAILEKDLVDPTPTQISYLETLRSSFRKLQRKRPFTHCFIHPICIYGPCSAKIRFSEMNFAPRIPYEASMSIQEQGIPLSTIYTTGARNNAKVLLNPVDPVIRTPVQECILPNNPTAVNVFVAITLSTTEGSTQEDSMDINKYTIESGALHACQIKSKVADFSADEKLGYPTLSNFEDAKVYSKIDNRGLPILGSHVNPGDCVVGKIRVRSDGRQTNSSILMGIGEQGRVSNIELVSTVGENISSINVTIQDFGPPNPGDKFRLEPSQKDTCSNFRPYSTFPFCVETGIVPNVILNPHAIPSRATLTPEIEMLVSKAAALTGKKLNGTAFSQTAELIEWAQNVLREKGLNYVAKDAMINGRTGEMFEVLIFNGPAALAFLKHRSNTKDTSRARGNRTPLRQPLRGRANNGGLRHGEMENHSVEAHGAAQFLQQQLLKNSDAYPAVFCTTCGHLAIYNQQSDKQFRCDLCSQRNVEEFTFHEVPFALIVLMSHFAAFGIDIRLNFIQSEDWKNCASFFDHQALLDEQNEAEIALEGQEDNWQNKFLERGDDSKLYYYHDNDVEE